MIESDARYGAVDVESTMLEARRVIVTNGRLFNDGGFASTMQSTTSSIVCLTFTVWSGATVIVPCSEVCIGVVAECA